MRHGITLLPCALWHGLHEQMFGLAFRFADVWIRT